MFSDCVKLRIMDGVDNNQFEVKPINSKRKIIPCSNVYLNPALDILANDDRICNTAMEIVPNKKRKCTKNSDIATFENTGLDLGSNKAPVNELLVREIDNVRRNFKFDPTVTSTELPSNEIPKTAPEDTDFTFNLGSNETDIRELPSNIVVNGSNKSLETNPEPIYANVTNVSEDKINETDARIDLQSTDISRIPHEDNCTDSGMSVLEQKPHKGTNDISNVSNITNIHTKVSNNVVIKNSNLSLSFIDRLALDSPNISDQSLYLDDDLNESNIMEIKTITIITKKKRIVDKKNTNPFLDPKLNIDIASTSNPFLEMNEETEYHEAILNRNAEPLNTLNTNLLMPRRLFSGDTNSTISTVNETSIENQPEYENIDNFRVESPIYENIEDALSCNKQSKILGHDVSQFSAKDIMNLNKLTRANCSNDSCDNKKDLKHSFLKVGNKLSKKVFKTLKKTFKHDKVDTNVTLNPYEVPRKLPKQKEFKKDSGIENPALNLDLSDDMEIEELVDEEHQYETIKTRRNTEYNMNVTPLKPKDNDLDFLPNKTNTPGKKVRFDSTLNQEKVITGNSFDYDLQSPGFDAKIEKYHDELENCINERKFLQQNM